jgi:hypothetical protein
MSSEEFKKTLEKLFYDVALRNVVEKALVKFPMLALPGFAQIFKAIVVRTGRMLIDELGKTTYSLIVDFKTKADKEEYELAVGKLRTALLNGNLNSREEVENAKEDFRRTLHDLVVLDD